MPRSVRGGTHPVAIKIAVVLVWAVWAPVSAVAFPDGAPWDSGVSEAGCTRCHFGSQPLWTSRSIQILGLPDRFESGARYRLVVRLRSSDMEKAGFLLTAQQGEEAGGTFIPGDEDTEARGSQIRSTEAGATPGEPGSAEWTVEWDAPSSVEAPVTLILWANAADGDHSPFGDRIHMRVWQRDVQAGRGDEDGP